MIKSLILGRTKTSSIKDANFLDLSHKEAKILQMAIPVQSKFHKPYKISYALKPSEYKMEMGRPSYYRGSSLA